MGLGHEFLRHIERTKLMIHVVDAAGTEGRDPVDDIYKINAELKAYNADIANRPQVIAANKIDAIYSDPENDPIKRLKDEFEPQGYKVFPISGVTGEGLNELLYYVSDQLKDLDAAPIVFEQEYFPEDELIYVDLPYTVEKRRWYVCRRRTKDRENAWLYQSGFREGICILPEVPEGYWNPERTGRCWY